MFRDLGRVHIVSFAVGIVGLVIGIVGIVLAIVFGTSQTTCATPVPPTACPVVTTQQCNTNLFAIRTTVNDWPWSEDLRNPNSDAYKMAVQNMTNTLTASLNTGLNSNQVSAIFNVLAVSGPTSNNVKIEINQFADGGNGLAIAIGNGAISAAVPLAAMPNATSVQTVITQQPNTYKDVDVSPQVCNTTCTPTVCPTYTTPTPPDCPICSTPTPSDCPVCTTLAPVTCSTPTVQTTPTTVPLTTTPTPVVTTTTTSKLTSGPTPQGTTTPTATQTAASVQTSTGTQTTPTSAATTVTTQGGSTSGPVITTNGASTSTAPGTITTNTPAVPSSSASTVTNSATSTTQGAPSTSITPLVTSASTQGSPTTGTPQVTSTSTHGAPSTSITPPVTTASTQGSPTTGTPKETTTTMGVPRTSPTIPTTVGIISSTIPSTHNPATSTPIPSQAPTTTQNLSTSSVITKTTQNSPSSSPTSLPTTTNVLSSSTQMKTTTQFLSSSSPGPSSSVPTTTQNLSTSSLITKTTKNSQSSFPTSTPTTTQFLSSSSPGLSPSVPTTTQQIPTSSGPSTSSTASNTQTSSPNLSTSSPSIPSTSTAPLTSSSSPGTSTAMPTIAPDQCYYQSNVAVAFETSSTTDEIDLQIQNFITNNLFFYSGAPYILGNKNDKKTELSLVPYPNEDQLIPYMTYGEASTATEINTLMSLFQQLAQGPSSIADAFNVIPKNSRIGPPGFVILVANSADSVQNAISSATNLKNLGFEIITVAYKSSGRFTDLSSDPSYNFQIHQDADQSGVAMAIGTILNSSYCLSSYSSSAAPQSSSLATVVTSTTVGAPSSSAGTPSPSPIISPTVTIVPVQSSSVSPVPSSSLGTSTIGSQSSTVTLPTIPTASSSSPPLSSTATVPIGSSTSMFRSSSTVSYTTTNGPTPTTCVCTTVEAGSTTPGYSTSTYATSMGSSSYSTATTPGGTSSTSQQTQQSSTQGGPTSSPSQQSTTQGGSTASPSQQSSTMGGSTSPSQQSSTMGGSTSPSQQTSTQSYSSSTYSATPSVPTGSSTSSPSVTSSGTSSGTVPSTVATSTPVPSPTTSQICPNQQTVFNGQVGVIYEMVPVSTQQDTINNFVENILLNSNFYGLAVDNLTNQNRTLVTAIPYPSTSSYNVQGYGSARSVNDFKNQVIAFNGVVQPLKGDISDALLYVTLNMTTPAVKSSLIIVGNSKTLIAASAPLLAETLRENFDIYTVAVGDNAADLSTLSSGNGYSFIGNTQQIADQIGQKMATSNPAIYCPPPVLSTSAPSTSTIITSSTSPKITTITSTTRLTTVRPTVGPCQCTGRWVYNGDLAIAFEYLSGSGGSQNVTNFVRNTLLSNPDSYGLSFDVNGNQPSKLTIVPYPDSSTYPIYPYGSIHNPSEIGTFIDAFSGIQTTRKDPSISDALDLIDTLEVDTGVAKVALIVGSDGSDVASSTNSATTLKANGYTVITVAQTASADVFRPLASGNQYALHIGDGNDNNIATQIANLLLDISFVCFDDGSSTPSPITRCPGSPGTTQPGVSGTTTIAPIVSTSTSGSTATQGSSTVPGSSSTSSSGSSTTQSPGSSSTVTSGSSTASSTVAQRSSTAQVTGSSSSVASTVSQGSTSVSSVGSSTVTNSGLSTTQASTVSIGSFTTGSSPAVNTGSTTAGPSTAINTGSTTVALSTSMNTGSTTTGLSTAANTGSTTAGSFTTPPSTVSSGSTSTGYSTAANTGSTTSGPSTVENTGSTTSGRSTATQGSSTAANAASTASSVQSSSVASTTSQIILSSTSAIPSCAAPYTGRIVTVFEYNSPDMAELQDVVTFVRNNSYNSANYDFTGITQAINVPYPDTDSYNAYIQKFGDSKSLTDLQSNIDTLVYYATLHKNPSISDGLAWVRGSLEQPAAGTNTVIIVVGHDADDNFGLTSSYINQLHAQGYKFISVAVGANHGDLSTIADKPEWYFQVGDSNGQSVADQISSILCNL
ncbi:hypothetical protein GCK72_006312 [Caenorhabditis remanei]|uniref:VWFA domain-containing protein n=1 Tax=Caenorhabditis remanei TaxID=31234 RepID=A0A6A5HFX4_CAERE|nr:hypothetical protein GCK72_006312 [Caenorhabditis remanei]KAF1766355.1 hypothetical protein GCK72_006312 [Caenorhabditis remanei]